MPRVSVIVPAHNAEPFIERTIESVREQTYRDWEIVVVDDGSSDGTWELLQALGPHVRSFRREHAGGPAVARNLALEHATGEFAAFLDADDLLLPRYLESQLDCHEAAVREHRNEVREHEREVREHEREVREHEREVREHRSEVREHEREVREHRSEVGLVSCDARILLGDEYAPYTHLQRIPDRYAPITLERVLRRNPIYGACLVPTVVGEAVGWFDPELFGTEDFGLWIKILEAGYRAVLNEEVLAVYRRTAGTVSSNIASQAANNRRAYALALDRGRLTAKQRRIARRAIRYNRAMEEVALLRFADARGARAWLGRLRSLPLLIWVALGNPRMWPQWLELLRSGQAKDAVELRALSKCSDR